MMDIDLGLGPNDEDHPRRLVVLPDPSAPLSPHILAYGGDDGTISVLVTNKQTKATTVRPARRFDEPVRAVAVSTDGTRVAVGLEDGSTQIFVYPQEAPTEQKQHGFLSSPPTSNDDDDDDHDDFGLSQSDGLSGTSSNGGETIEVSFAGPRLDVPIRDLRFDPRPGSYFLAVASEASFCVVDATSSNTLVSKGRLLQDACEREHDGSGIRGLVYSDHSQDERGTFLATLGMDGRLCTWDVSGPMNDLEIDEWNLVSRDKSKCIAKPDVGELNGSDVYDRSCLPVALSLSSSQDDTSTTSATRLFALPGSTDVQLRSWTDPSKECFVPSVENRGHVDTIVAMAFSPEGEYLVTSGRDGRVLLWELNNNENGETGHFFCKLGQYKSTPTHFLWSKGNSNEVLYIACADGTLVTIVGRDKIVPTPTKKSSQPQIGNVLDTQLETKLPPVPPPSSNSRKRLSKQQPRGSANSGNDNDNDTGHLDSDDDLAFDEDIAADSGKKTTFLDDQAEEDDDDDDDDNHVPGHFPTNSVENRDLHVDGNDDFEFVTNDDQFPAGSSASNHIRTIELPDPQPAFAPSSTPLDLPRRIMCWNHIGTVTLLRNDDGLTRNTVDIEFTDVALRRPVNFTDNMNFILGSLGEDGAVFATDLKEDDEGALDEDEQEFEDDFHMMSAKTKAAVKRSHRKRLKSAKGGGSETGSSIYFHRFETFGALRDKDWYLTLPGGERAMGCATGEGWAAVMTSRRFLRFFTAGGNQGAVIWLKGEPITMVGRGRFLAVFTHESAPLADGTQKVAFTLYDAVTSREITCGSTSCISAGSFLSWAGFSNDCSLMAMDNDGMLSMLIGIPEDDLNSGISRTDSFSWEWAPMLDTIGLRKSNDDSFWPVTIQDGKFVCVPLKGGNEHPDAARRPVTTTMGLRMPLARASLEKSHALEELSVRANMALYQKKFMNGMIAVDEADEADLEDEYNSLSAQVDKVTLKLFMTTVQAGKLERSLDLVDRLHLEKSFEIAIRVADQMNHRNLSDRIEDIKTRKFAEPLEEDENLGDDADQQSPSYPSQSDNFAHPDSLTHTDDETADSRKISPEIARHMGKRTLQETYDEEEEEDKSPRQEKPRTRFDSEPILTKKTNERQMNPFAKKRLESPGRKPTIMSPTKSPSRLSLSRTSTFSAQSREKSKVARRIM